MAKGNYCKKYSKGLLGKRKPSLPKNKLAKRKILYTLEFTIDIDTPLTLFEFSDCINTTKLKLNKNILQVVVYPDEVSSIKELVKDILKLLGARGFIYRIIYN